MRFRCKDIHVHASDYLDGRLSLLQRAQYRIHLFICGPCATFIKQMRTTLAALHQLPLREPSPNEVEDQVAKLRAIRDAKPM